MRSLIESGMRQNYVLCIEIIRRIMDIIAWAQEEWKDIPDEERGQEFSPEFHRQLQAVLLENVENVRTCCCLWMQALRVAAASYNRRVSFGYKGTGRRNPRYDRRVQFPRPQ